MTAARQSDGQTALALTHTDPSLGTLLPTTKQRSDRSPTVHRAIKLSAFAPSSGGLFVRPASKATRDDGCRAPSYTRREYRRFGVDPGRQQRLRSWIARAPIMGCKGSDHGLQDKSADRGWAQGIGQIDDCWRRDKARGWRARHKRERTQCENGHRSISSAPGRYDEGEGW